MNIEILHIHEDDVTTKIFTLMLLSGLLVLVSQNVKRRTECFSEKVLYVCEEERWHTVSLQKFVGEIHLGAAIDRFLCSLPLNKPFSVISGPAIKQKSICKTPQKIGQHCRRTRAKKR